MKGFIEILIIIVLFAAGGFKFSGLSTTSNLVSGNSIDINSHTSKLKSNISVVPDYFQLGVWTASWYGPKFHGRLTANGEIYDQMSFTAAHKSMKFGTYLRVTNLRNSKKVIVRINDRGPYIEGRSIDLSKASALALGMIPSGVIKVKIEEINFNQLKSPIFSY